MTYLVADDLPPGNAGDRFRALLERPEILQMPGTHNGRPPCRHAPPASRRSTCPAPP